MALGQELDRPAVLAGLRSGLFIVAPAGLFTAALAQDLPALLRVVFVLIIVAGFATAGAQAARVATQNAVASASFAALFTYLALQIPLALIRLARGEAVNVWTYIFLALTSMSCGVIGALLVLRAKARAEAADDAEFG